MNSDRVRCNWCLEMVRPDDVHSCYDARKVVDQRDAERAVLSAARAWWDYRGGPHDVLRAKADRELTETVARLIKLEGGR